MNILNYTSRTLYFAKMTNLVERGVNRYYIESRTKLVLRWQIAPAGKCLLAKSSRQELESIGKVPVFKDVIESVDKLPDGDELIIVSKAYADACRLLGHKTDRLLIPYGQIFTGESFTPIASIGLMPVDSLLNQVNFVVDHYPSNLA